MTRPETGSEPPASAASVGRILSPHGVRGELKIQPLTDFPDRFKRGETVLLQGAAVRIERSRAGRGLLYVKLEGIDSREDALALQGLELQVDRPRPLDGEDRFYIHDIVGLEVVDAAGGVLGRVVEVLVTGANDVYVVRGERGEVLLPAIDDVITRVDLAGGRIHADLPDGLDFTPPPAAKPVRARRPRRR